MLRRPRSGRLEARGCHMRSLRATVPAVSPFEILPNERPEGRIERITSALRPTADVSSSRLVWSVSDPIRTSWSFAIIGFA